MKLLAIILFVSISFGINAQTITLATDGSGDYNCNGTNDEIEINQAITDAFNQGGGTVHLKNGIYIIDNPIIMKSNITFEGESDTTTIIKLADEADWGVHPDSSYPIYHDAESFIIGDGSTNVNPNWQYTIGRIENVTLQNFKIDGNKYNQHYVDLNGDTVLIEGGTSNYTAIDLGDPYDATRSNNLTFSNVRVENNLGDAISLQTAKNININHCKSANIGHSAAYLMDVLNVLAEYNEYDIYANSGIRIDMGNHIIIRNNHLFSSDNAGNFGVQISHRYTTDVMNDVLIEKNLIEDIPYAGIALYTDDPSITDSVIIRNNLIYRCGLPSVANESGGINIFNFNNTIIENNTIFNNCAGGIVFGVNPYYPNGLTGNKTAYIRNNIITSSIGLGIDSYGIYLENGDNTNLIMENNNVWGNQTANYYNCSAGNNSISVDPLFVVGQTIADKWDVPYPTLDLHLQQNSPCINTGVTTTNVTDDYDNNSRPYGSAYDIGALEYVGPLSISDITDNELLTYPNPFTDLIIIDENINISEISIFNILGVDVSNQVSFEKTNEKIVISTAKLQGGIYIIKTKTSANKVYKSLSEW